MSRCAARISIAVLGGVLAVGSVAPAAAQSGDGTEQLPEPSKLEETSDSESESGSEGDPRSDAKSEEPSPDRTEVPGRAPEPASTQRSSGGGVSSDELPSADEITDEKGTEPPPKVPASGEGSEVSPAPPGSDPVPVEDDGKPPIQVRRAVEVVESSAHSVAGSVSGERHSQPGESGGASQRAGPDPRVRKLNRDDNAEDDSASGDSADAPADAAPAADELFGRVATLFREVEGERVSLDPHVDDPRWERAMQLVVENDCREALDLVDTVVDESDRNLKQIPAVRYAIARVKMCAGRGADGRETLRALEKRDDVVAELAGRRLGESPAPIRPDREGPSTWTERLQRARETARSGDISEALERLAALRGELERAWHRYKVQMTEANLLLRKGEIREAARRLTGLYRMTRDWKIGDRVTEKIEGVEERHDIDILPFGDRIDRMRELIERGKYRKAKTVSIENAKIAGVSGSEIRGWSFYRRALQAEQRRRREQADELFEKAEKLVDSPVIRSRLYFGWGRALRRLDRDDEAIELYRRLCREFPRHHLCDDARFEEGRLQQYQNEHDAAREAFANLLGMHPNSEYVPDALWRGAFSAYLAGDYREMDRPLRRLVREYPDETDASGLPVSLKAQYWLGAAALERGETGVAERRFQETINRGALTWYGRLAAERMEQIGTEPVIPKPTEQLSPAALHDLSTLDLPANPRFRVAAAYARLGLYDDAIEEMNRQIDAAPVPDKAHRFLANLKLVDERRAAAHWMMHDRIDGATPTHGRLRDWGLAYPVVFREPARKYSTEYGVSPHLVQGIMRQESGFRPEVSSGVGAVGLMQLMPGTANAVADEFFDGSYVSRSQLRRPKRNIRMGTAYIRGMIARVKGRVPLALAGYNAGPAPLDDWFDRFGERDVDAWVESITYRQARGYVRKVYTSYTRYAALYDGRLPDLTLEMPDEFGEWGEVPELKDRDVEKRPVSWKRLGR